MPLMEDLKQLTAPVAAPQAPAWIKDLIDRRYQPQTERLKRVPVGFDFKREPFDPSSYYKAMGTNRDISRGATAVAKQETYNRQQAEREKAFADSQQQMMDALNGINPQFTYGNGSGSTNYKLGGVSGNTKNAANHFGSRYGIKTVYGVGPGSVPGSDHPKGRALDFMTSNKAKGTALANDVIKNYKAWNVKYVIWNRYIWHPGRGWKKYSGPSDHTDHVHVSFNK